MKTGYPAYQVVLYSCSPQFGAVIVSGFTVRSISRGASGGAPFLFQFESVSLFMIPDANKATTTGGEVGGAAS